MPTKLSDLSLVCSDLQDTAHRRSLYTQELVGRRCLSNFSESFLLQTQS